MRTLQQIATEVDELISLGLTPQIDDQPKRQAEIKRIARNEAQWYLNSTDWYIIRKFERNIDVPEEVSTLRLQAIQYLNGNP